MSRLVKILTGSPERVPVHYLASVCEPVVYYYFHDPGFFEHHGDERGFVAEVAVHWDAEAPFRKGVRKMLSWDLHVDRLVKLTKNVA
jgi:hypothetical protein